MTRNKKRPLEPPELPALRRRLKFGPWQLAGLGILVLIPILALFRVFGEREASVTGQAGALALAVEYSPQLRHGSSDIVVAMVTNAGGSVMDTVTVAFDSNYVSRVAEPRFVPPATRALELDLINVVPGEARRIELWFYAEDYGSHRGHITAAHAGDTARVNVGTLVFP
ncbi:MAG: hypothetical protein ACR2L6_04750 [Gemmatimonadaceae bacterium]